LAPQKVFKPRRLLGGLTVQQEEVGQNVFGSVLTAELAHIFNPISREERLRVAREGYVSSPRRDRYVDPIDRIIRAATPNWQSRSTLISDPASPLELLRPLASPKELEHRILLLIGEKGSGKTTFLYHLQAVALPLEIRERTVWVHIDANTAPVVKNELYDWVRKEITRLIRSIHSDHDFDDLDVKQRVFSVEVNKFKKSAATLLGEGSKEYNYELYKLLLSCESDFHRSAVCHTRYFGSEKNRLIVVVFDNTDKKSRDEQLLMFEVAQWLQKEFRALVVLPIREETYDNHRDEPPFDTALKDLVFRIEPPVFLQALVKRVQMALNEIGSGSSRRTYELPNGFKVNYSESERSYYITSIVASIFEYDSYVRRMIMGLAGNNVRQMFEIFVNFCMSGHISDAEILRMRQSKGDYILPLDVVMTILIRSSRRFYDGDASIVKNILDMDDKDLVPSYFVRVMVLYFLKEKFNESGPNGLKGYFRLSNLHDALSKYGVTFAVLQREVNYLVRADCLIPESLTKEDISEDELIKLGPVGFVHLELLGIPEYWAAVAEDTNFDSFTAAKRIADRIAVRDEHYGQGVSLQNARAVLDYLKIKRSEAGRLSDALLSRSEFLRLTDIDVAEGALAAKRAKIQGGAFYEAAALHPVGSEVEGIVINSNPEFGLFIEIAPGVTGLLHRSRLVGGAVTAQSPGVGERLRVRVTRVVPAQRRLSLSLIGQSKGRS
jgi:energy-coupling factor transporter ATP-binding protein EcfA2